MAISSSKTMTYSPPGTPLPLDKTLPTSCPLPRARGEISGNTCQGILILPYLALNAKWLLIFQPDPGWFLKGCLVEQVP